MVQRNVISRIPLHIRRSVRVKRAQLGRILWPLLAAGTAYGVANYLTPRAEYSSDPIERYQQHMMQYRSLTGPWQRALTSIRQIDPDLADTLADRYASGNLDVSDLAWGDAFWKAHPTVQNVLRELYWHGDPASGSWSVTRFFLPWFAGKPRMTASSHLQEAEAAYQAAQQAYMDAMDQWRRASNTPVSQAGQRMVASIMGVKPPTERQRWQQRLDTLRRRMGHANIDIPRPATAGAGVSGSPASPIYPTTPAATPYNPYANTIQQWAVRGYQ